MAKDKVTDWDVDPTENLDVGGIAIANPNSVSHGAGAMREIMAQFAAVMDGTDAFLDNTSLADPDDLTKRVRVDAGNITTGQTRVLTMADRDIDMANLVEAADLAQITNLVINGDFAINQRGFAGGALAGGDFGHDRWKAEFLGGANYTVAAGVVTLTGLLQQVIEAPGLAGATVTVSVEDPSDDIGVKIIGGSGDDTGTITAGSGRRGVTLTVPADATGNVTLQIGGGSFSRVSLNVGSVALPFERRHPATELALCQRYFQKSYDLADAPGSVTNDGAEIYFNHGVGGATGRRIVPLMARMRAAPSVTIYNPETGTTGEVRNATTNGNVAATVEFLAQRSFRAGATTGQSNNDQLRFHWTADAEL